MPQIIFPEFLGDLGGLAGSRFPGDKDDERLGHIRARRETPGALMDGLCYRPFSMDTDAAVSSVVIRILLLSSYQSRIIAWMRSSQPSVVNFMFFLRTGKPGCHFGNISLLTQYFSFLGPAERSISHLRHLDLVMHVLRVEEHGKQVGPRQDFDPGTVTDRLTGQSRRQFLAKHIGVKDLGIIETLIPAVRPEYLSPIHRFFAETTVKLLSHLQVHSSGRQQAHYKVARSIAYDIRQRIHQQIPALLFPHHQSE